MASKKATKKSAVSTRRNRASRVAPRKDERRNSIFDYFRLTESYASLLLGLVVVIIAAILVISFVRNRTADTVNPDRNISATQTQQTDQAAQGAPKPGSTYVVKAGDDLWKIAEQAYQDGYKWTEIAKANNITDPGMISTGQRLSIPESGSTIAQAVSPTQVVVSPTQTQVSTTPTIEASQQAPVGQKITGATYTVVHGDYLWEIAVRAYGDGYKWVEIARANKLTNPDIIHTGNVLRLPR